MWVASGSHETTRHMLPGSCSLSFWLGSVGRKGYPVPKAEVHAEGRRAAHLHQLRLAYCFLDSTVQEEIEILQAIAF